jgi:hypothetical protein
MKIIEHNGLRLAIFIGKDDFKKGLSFCSNDKDFIQVGLWGYDNGKELAAHSHNCVHRDIDRTQEVVFVVEGMVEASIYSEDQTLIQRVIVQKGETLILLNGGHGYKILDDNTYVLEVKNGPYLGAEIDRTRLSLENKR